MRSSRYLPAIGVAITLAWVLAPAANAGGSACETGLPIDLPEDCAAIEVEHPFDALTNFRAITTPADGPRIKANTLFRSDQLDALTDADIASMSELGIETIVDLRAHEELETHPDRLIPSVNFSVNLPIGSDPADVAKIIDPEVAAQIRLMWFAGKFAEIDQLLTDHNVNLTEVRKDRYRDFARDFTPQISRYMRMLTNADNFPMVFHCAGGKDRTGFVAAVTMLTLGYSESDVLRDYLTTNVYTFDELAGLVENGPMSLRPAFGAHAEQIMASLAAIREDHGSFETYRRDVLGISDDDVGLIKANLLQ